MSDAKKSGDAYDRLSINREVINLTWLVVMYLDHGIPTHELVRVRNQAPSVRLAHQNQCRSIKY